MFHRTLTPFTCMLLVASVAYAQTPADSWDHVIALNRGDGVRVTTLASDRIHGRFVEANDTRLQIDVVIPSVAGTATGRFIPRSNVRMVERIGRRSLMGTGIGLAAGLIAGFVVLTTVDPKDSVGVAPYHELPVMLFTTGVGAGAGGLIDVLRQPKVEVIYMAAASPVGPPVSTRQRTARNFVTAGTSAAVFRSSAIDGKEIAAHASIGRFITPIISISGEIIGPVTIDARRECRDRFADPDRSRQPIVVLPAGCRRSVRLLTPFLHFAAKQ
jgi:hypothetical protein